MCSANYPAKWPNQIHIEDGYDTNWFYRVPSGNRCHLVDCCNLVRHYSAADWERRRSWWQALARKDGLAIKLTHLSWCHENWRWLCSSKSKNTNCVTKARWQCSLLSLSVSSPHKCYAATRALQTKPAHATIMQNHVAHLNCEVLATSYVHFALCLYVIVHC